MIMHERHLLPMKKYCLSMASKVRQIFLQKMHRVKFARQYPKNIGRTLEVLDTEGSKIEGVLTAVDAEKITLEWEDIRKEGKKKIKEMVTKELPFSKIKRTMVVVKF